MLTVGRLRLLVLCAVALRSLPLERREAREIFRFGNGLVFRSASPECVGAVGCAVGVLDSRSLALFAGKLTARNDLAANHANLRECHARRARSPFGCSRRSCSSASIRGSNLAMVARSACTSSGMAHVLPVQRRPTWFLRKVATVVARASFGEHLSIASVAFHPLQTRDHLRFLAKSKKDKKQKEQKEEQKGQASSTRHGCRDLVNFGL